MLFVLILVEEFPQGDEYDCPNRTIIGVFNDQRKAHEAGYIYVNGLRALQSETGRTRKSYKYAVEGFRANTLTVEF